MGLSVVNRPIRPTGLSPACAPVALAAAPYPTIEAVFTTEPIVSQDESLTAALALLSDEHREVLLLRFVDGLGLAEIAETLEFRWGR